MEQKKFKSGDVVCLKSGGPEMSVQGYVNLGFGVVTDNVLCKWFEDKKQQQGEFHEDSLEICD
ncbi:DUF2158 domain-containing protein [Mucilaginibacter achroorhodeus]|uniref:DUF2158 domain-containing protein n=1 Tax=Mucilaginibacter achroorhodeus TaxID=2599294 RepID=A0A563TYW6_9SPHI|nr:DUF2158 domain-containing protein [Mucilaginibacter achroorhodeus]TWR24565.1 DUF2158 domain-containing protein [Mucilaginibacter achroorhodeus]